MNTLQRFALGCAAVFTFTCTAAAQSAGASPTPQLAKAATPTPSPASSSATTTTTTTAAPPATAAPAPKAAPKGLPPLPPEKSQAVRIARFDKAPVIDGKLDDEIWKSAAVLKDFYQINPGDNIAPSKATETHIGYDAKFLYIAFHCYDEPDKVRATVPRRDNVMNTDDSVRILLDTFNDKRKAYVLAFNPLGVQQDGIRTEGMGADFTPDIVMESKGTITSDGYVVEVAIPFKSLRYEAGKDKQWGVQVFRIIQRLNGEQDSWMPISRDVDGLLNQAGHITGLEGISTERTVELIPSFIVSETGRHVRSLSRAQAAALGVADSGVFVNQPVKFEPGLTAKFVASAALTLDLAVNPDFAQVEADAPVSFANQRFPIFFEEKRPFFLEGIEIFRTQIAAVHTRTIADPDIAAKVTGRKGKYTYGLLYASDNAPGNYEDDIRYDPERLPSAFDRLNDQNSKVGILRVKRDIGKESFVGFLATSYNFADKSNYVGGFDARLKFDKQTSLDFQVLGTNAKLCSFAKSEANDRCATQNGFVYAYNFNKNARHHYFNVNGVGRTQGYVALVGFTRRVNTNAVNTNFGYFTEPKPKAKVTSWETNHYAGGSFDWQGRSQNWTYEGQFGPNLQRQSFVRVGYNTGYERVFGYEFGTARFANGLPENSAYSKNVFAYAGSTPTKRINFFYFFGYRWGQLDYDFGAGRRFPRVSASAVAQREAIADGLCTNSPSDPSDCAGLPDPGAGGYLYTNGNVTYKATKDLNMLLSFSKNRLVRDDTGLVAFDTNILSLKTTYQFTRFSFARARIDYDSTTSRYSGQFLFGWTPNPGTAFYVGYNDDLNHNYFNRFSTQPVDGLLRNSRSFFIKASYLFRRSF
ncbi:MAG: carbohydrate binding family 9 domain-containing protein [Acidobacteria bacterium]|nr:carbohydrate binding family 9 domain-containing protein [Acidobacteriota bacterium]